MAQPRIGFLAVGFGRLDQAVKLSAGHCPLGRVAEQPILSTDDEGPDRTFGGVESLGLSYATTFSIGGVQLARADQVKLGTDNTMAVTPLGLKSTYSPSFYEVVGAGTIDSPFVNGTVWMSHPNSTAPISDIHVSSAVTVLKVKPGDWFVLVNAKAKDWKVTISDGAFLNGMQVEQNCSFTLLPAATCTFRWGSTNCWVVITAASGGAK